jgi:hypothetical protein
MKNFGGLVSNGIEDASSGFPVRAGLERRLANYEKEGDKSQCGREACVVAPQTKSFVDHLGSILVLKSNARPALPSEIIAVTILATATKDAR